MSGCGLGLGLGLVEGVKGWRDKGVEGCRREGVEGGGCRWVGGSVSRQIINGKDFEKIIKVIIYHEEKCQKVPIFGIFRQITHRKKFQK